VKRSAPGWFGGDAAPAPGDEALFCSSEICISVEFEQLPGVDAEAGEEMLRIAGVLIGSAEPLERQCILHAIDFEDTL